METKPLKAFCLLALASVSTTAFAQYVGTPPPGETPPPAPMAPGRPSPAAAGGTYLHLEPKNGQTEQQQWSDRYECHKWARTQSGFDPTQQTSGAAPGESPGKADDYRRAMAACLESRGYIVHYSATPTDRPTPAAAPPPPPPPMGSTHVRYVSSEPELRYRPLTVAIEGGFTGTVGSTDHLLDDGANIGLGFTYFPTSVIPVGLRVDGSYSRFRARHDLRDQFGPDFTSGHDNIYGGDVDLQLNLANPTSWMKLYLFGGAGWYREQTYLRQVSYFPGEVCGWYFCGPGYYPALTGTERATSNWHSSWNAGLGWEMATGSGASFFVEARYQRIAVYNGSLQFVPVRVGVRF
jgi:hypothetical protein